LFPQQKSRPAAITAQVWSIPAATSETASPVGSPSTSTGVSELEAPAARPSWPWSLDPQHRSRVPAMAQVCSAPVATAAARQHASPHRRYPGSQEKLQRCETHAGTPPPTAVWHTSQVEPQLVSLSTTQAVPQTW
jgi:hypothetical protein